MPDIYTHILNGRESLKRFIKLESCYKERERKIFYLGCMGPDIFFYHYFYPLSRNIGAWRLGGLMHRKHCGECISESMKYIKESSNFTGLKDERVIYMLGYLCHYAMDRMAHPYVFSRSGVYKRDDKNTHRFKMAHKVMELAIDHHMAERLDHADINKIKVYNFIDIEGNIPSGIEDLYIFMLKRYFKEFLKFSRKIVNESYKGMINAWKLLYDPYFIKRRILKGTLLNELFYPLDPDKRDYMNDKKDIWLDPCSCSIQNENFYELFKKSVNLSVELINASIDYLKGSLNFKSYRKIVGNFSFLTNKDLESESQEMKCFSPIF